MALPDPITRKEMYLNKAATGEGNVPPEPVTREEMYLAEIAKGGGGSGGAVPQPSDEAPQMVGNVSSAGNSAQYARADHSHEFDFDTFPAAALPLVVTLVPSSQENPFAGTYVGATPDQLGTAFLSGRKILAKLGNQYIAPSILNGNVLYFYYTYKAGNVVYYIISRMAAEGSEASYSSSLYTGLTGV